MGPAKPDRFDLELAINDIEYLANDIDLIAEAYADENFSALSETELLDFHDRHLNVLIGVAELLRLRSGRLFDIFKKVHGLDRWRKKI